MSDRDEKGRFGRGNTARAGHKGARRRLEESLVSDLVDVWRQHGKPALVKVALEEPGRFCTIAASILPKHSESSLTFRMEAMSEAELAALIQDCEAEIQAALAGGEGEDLDLTLAATSTTETKH